MIKLGRVPRKVKWVKKWWKKVLSW
jgi:ribosomal protein L24E